MSIAGLAGFPHLALAYFIINIDPIAFSLGPIAVHWYGIMYVVAITIALWVLLKYTARQGIHEDQVWGIFIWTVIAGLIGGRLYFVLQQPNLVQNYLLRPQNIIAVWNGGMAFYGAIFAGALTLFLIAPSYGIDRFLAIDCGALFAATSQLREKYWLIVADWTGHPHIPAVTLPDNVRLAGVQYLNTPHYDESAILSEEWHRA